jgi:hypothetical protein
MYLNCIVAKDELKHFQKCNKSYSNCGTVQHINLQFCANDVTQYKTFKNAEVNIYLCEVLMFEKLV